MFCNQIFSILKKKTEPVTETPVEEEVIGETTPEETPEGQTESVTVSEEETPEEETVTETTEGESPTYVVANVIVCESYEIASRIARCEFGESALAIDTTLFPVAIGDTYRDGVFYDSLGNAIKRNPTESEQIEALTLKNIELNEIVNALLGLEG